MRRGRPVGSDVRQNIVEILFFMGSAHGYQIYKVYRQIFPQITLRAVYYHLKKGLDTGEFEKAVVEKEKGDYSWGTEAEKTYYSLSKNAKVSGSAQVQAFFQVHPEFRSKK